MDTYQTPRAVALRNAVVLGTVVLGTFVTLRLWLWLVPNADFDVAGYNLHHLFTVDEQLGKTLGTIHNIHFYMTLTARARQAILEDRYLQFKRDFYEEFLGHPDGREAMEAARAASPSSWNKKGNKKPKRKR